MGTSIPAISMIPHEIIWWDIFVVRVIHVIQVLQVIQVTQLIQVMQVTLAHLWPDFQVVLIFFLNLISKDRGRRKREENCATIIFNKFVKCFLKNAFVFLAENCVWKVHCLGPRAEDERRVCVKFLKQARRGGADSGRLFYKGALSRKKTLKNLNFMAKTDCPNCQPPDSKSHTSHNQFKCLQEGTEKYKFLLSTSTWNNFDCYGRWHDMTRWH